MQYTLLYFIWLHFVVHITDYVIKDVGLNYNLTNQTIG